METVNGIDRPACVPGRIETASIEDWQSLHCAAGGELPGIGASDPATAVGLV